MKVPFLELKPGHGELRGELDAAYHRAMDPGWYLLGKELEQFETEFAAHCQADFCTGLGNFLEALRLILIPYGIGVGDQVIPSDTFIATWPAVSYADATPVPVEPDPVTFKIAPERIETAITPKTKVVMLVHLDGQATDMDPIMGIARKHGLKVIEDNAQAQGARYKGRRTGSLGNAAATRFYPGKNLGAFGDAGALTSNDAELADRARTSQNYGSKKKYHNDCQDCNSRMDELEAAFLRVKLKRLDEWNSRRRAIATRHLSGLRGTSPLKMPFVPEWEESVWHLFALRHLRRDELHDSPAKVGVGTQVHYPIPPHLSGASAHPGWKPGDFPTAEEIGKAELNLPFAPHLEPKGQELTIRAVRRNCKRS